MGKWSENIWKKINEYERDETKNRISHSTSYHSHFQGFSERKVPGKSGKGYLIKRIYTADYYKYHETNFIWQLKKICYLLLLIGAVTALIMGGISSSDLNSIRFIGVTQVLAWIPIIYLVYNMIFQLLAHRMMTIGDYTVASLHLKSGALVSGIYTSVATTFLTVEKLLKYYDFRSEDLQAIIGELIGTILIFLIFFIENSRNVERVKNHTEVPYDANEIW